MSNATIVGLTTSEIDKAASGQSLTSESVLNGSGLSYLWSKIKAAFSAVGHKHSAADLTSGTLSADRIAADSVTSDKLAPAVRDSISHISYSGVDKVTFQAITSGSQNVGVRFDASDGRALTLYFNENQLGVWDNTASRAVWVVQTQ